MSRAIIGLDSNEELKKQTFFRILARKRDSFSLVNPVFKIRIAHSTIRVIHLSK